MSITCTFLLLLFLLCLSLHECNARLLGEVLMNKKSEEKFHHFSSKHHEDHKRGVDHEIAVLPNMKSSSSMEAQSTYDKTRYEIKEMKKTVPEERSKKKKGKGLDAVRTTTNSVVSVSWRVPHKKRGEKQPGFNLDYSPPKTHPPSHN